MPWENGERAVSDVAKHKDNELSEFQKALNDYGIDSVKEPSWLPEGYTLANVAVMDLGEFGIFSVSAVYKDSNGVSSDINIDISRSYASTVQIQNDSEIVNSYRINDIELYIIQNDENTTIAWIADGYESQIHGVSENQIKNVAESMII